MTYVHYYDLAWLPDPAQLAVSTIATDPTRARLQFLRAKYSVLE